MFICHLHITSPVSASHAAHAPRHIGIVTTAQPSGQKKQAQCRLTHPILHMPSIARKSAIDHLSLYPILSVTFKNQGILFPGRFPRPRVRLAAAGRCGVSPHGGKARIRATRGENSAVGGPSPLTNMYPSATQTHRFKISKICLSRALRYLSARIPNGVLFQNCSLRKGFDANECVQQDLARTGSLNG